MDDMTPGERAFADMTARGVDAEALLASVRKDPRQTAAGDVIIQCTDDDGAPSELAVKILRSAPNIRTAFALALAAQAKSIKAVSLDGRLGNLTSFMSFLDASDATAIKPRHITDAMLNDYRDWLDNYEKAKTSASGRPRTSVFPTDGGGKLKVTTKVAYMNEVCAVLRYLRFDPKWQFEISPDTDLERAGDWANVSDDRQPVEILTRPQLKMLVRICRAEVVETTKRLAIAWAVFDGVPPQEDIAPADRELLLEVQALHVRFDGCPPKKQSLTKALGHEEPHPFPRLRRLDTKFYNAAIAGIYPTERLIMPFLLLFAIYYRYNFSVVTTLKASDLSEQPSLDGGTRLRGMPYKNRAGRTQYASWPVNADADNPAQMLKTLERWTASVRTSVPDSHRNHLFLARTYNRNARSLAVRHVFDGAFTRFLEDNAEKLKRRFLFRAIRPSVINLVHHLFDGDLQVTAEAGQHGVDVMLDHYLFDGARKANQEALIEPMQLRDAWLDTKGLLDAREDKRQGDVAAATPGFMCRDRRASTKPGQKPGRLCTAYGMCPTCRLAGIDTTVPENYAFVIKLREALIRSRPRMSAETWIGRWSSILDRLELVTIRSFPDAVSSVSNLDIPSLPTME